MEKGESFGMDGVNIAAGGTGGEAAATAAKGESFGAGALFNFLRRSPLVSILVSAVGVRCDVDPCFL